MYRHAIKVGARRAAVSVTSRLHELRIATIAGVVCGAQPIPPLHASPRLDSTRRLTAGVRLAPASLPPVRAIASRPSRVLGRGHRHQHMYMYMYMYVYIYIDIYDRAIAPDPSRPRVRATASRPHRDRVATAHDRVTTASRMGCVCFLEVDERHYNAWYGLGAIYYRQEKFELAEYHFRRALSINGGSSVLHCYLGMVLHANKKCEEALELLEVGPPSPSAVAPPPPFAFSLPPSPRRINACRWSASQKQQTALDATAA